MSEVAVFGLTALAVGFLFGYLEARTHQRARGMREGLHVATHGFTPVELFGTCPFAGEHRPPLTCEQAEWYAREVVLEHQRQKG